MHLAHNPLGALPEEWEEGGGYPGAQYSTGAIQALELLNQVILHLKQMMFKTDPITRKRRLFRFCDHFLCSCKLIIFYPSLPADTRVSSLCWKPPLRRAVAGDHPVQEAQRYIFHQSVKSLWLPPLTVHLSLSRCRCGAAVLPQPPRCGMAAPVPERALMRASRLTVAPTFDTAMPVTNQFPLLLQNKFLWPPAESTCPHPSVASGN